jgi:hypothetical protein
MVLAPPVSNASQERVVVVASPASNVPCEGWDSGEWSQREHPAWLRTSTSANPELSEPIDSNLTTVSCTTIGDDHAIGRTDQSNPVVSSVTTASSTTIDNVTIASRAEGPTITSIDAINLQTEPKFPPEREPNNPDLVEARNQPDDADVHRSEPERQNAGAAAREDDPNRRLITTAVLLSTILVLFCSSLLASSSRRSPGPQREVSGGTARSGPILTRRASDGSSSSDTAGTGSIPTRRASFDVAPSGRRPEGPVTNQPRASPWDQVQQLRPSPERAKQNSVFHRGSDVVRAENCGALSGMRFLGIPVPRAMPWADMSFPLRGGIPDSATSKRASGGISVSGSAGPTPTRGVSEGISVSGSAGSISIRRVRIAIALGISRNL